MDPVPVSTSPLVPASETDRYFDYCLEPYTPRANPSGKWRGESLLWQSLEVAGASAPVAECLRAIQRHAGRDATVFGVKWAEGKLSWELYFYDPQKRDARVRVESIARVLAERFPFTTTVRESVPYFMFSFNLAPSLRTGDRIEALNLYLAEPVGQAGRSYRQTAASHELENTYHFFHPKRDVREVLYRIKSSSFVDFGVLDVGKVLFPELVTCNRVCVSKKRTADALYYSGIGVEQLAWFLRRFGWPAEISSFIEAEAPRLDH
ncbi:MAG TPA: hypothetical protein VGK73_35450, partial [Polyangiaceae bacterium]